MNVLEEAGLVKFRPEFYEDWESLDASVSAAEQM